jgi:hypothetical protein
LILFVLFKASGRTFSYDRAINAVGKILKSIFLSLASLSMSLFRCREHPSKEATLVMFPQVICSSDEWWTMFLHAQIAELGLTAFVALILYAVWKAPRDCITDSGFMVRYHFLFGALSAHKWWFIVLVLAYSLILNMVQILSRNGYVQVYCSVMVIMMFTVAQFHLVPYRHHVNNVVDVGLKMGLVMVLVLVTPFIRQVDEEEERVYLQWFGSLITGVIVTVVVAAGCRAAYNARVSVLMHEGARQARVIRFGHGFRDIISLVAELPLSDYNRFLGSLQDTDFQRLSEAKDVLVAGFLHLQPGENFFRQRLIPEAEKFEVVSNHLIARALLAHQSAGKAQRAHAERRWLRQLARILQECAESKAVRTTFKSTLTGERKWYEIFISNVRDVNAGLEDLFSIFDADQSGEMLQEEFVRGCRVALEATRWKGHFSDDQLARLFEIMDTDQSGSLRFAEFVATMQGMIDDIEVQGESAWEDERQLNRRGSASRKEVDFAAQENDQLDLFRGDDSMEPLTQSAVVLGAAPVVKEDGRHHGHIPVALSGTPHPERLNTLFAADFGGSVGGIRR